jgi:mono/diheme cytochrome c family protein
MGCNSYVSKLPAPQEIPIDAASIDYAFVNTKVFEPYCVRCHSDAGGNKGDVNLETYESVVSALTEIENVVFVERKMPPKRAGGPLSGYPLEVLKAWIEAGAPVVAGKPQQKPPPTTTTPQPTPTPTPPVMPPPPIVVEPTWADISSKIFQAKCVKCHSEGGKAEDDPLTDQSYVINPQNLILVPGKPEESAIIKAITREDNKRMPPAKTGMTLSPQEIETIQTWILNGAKD